MNRLAADPQWVADQQARDARHAATAARLKADEVSILDELAAVGIEVGSVYDFVGRSIAPPEAIRVLIRHLKYSHDPRIREGIFRALGVPSAREVAFEPLRAAYIVEHDPSMRWVIANSLSGMAQYHEVRELPGIEQYADLFPKRTKRRGRRA
jgi:hypothetical protein